MNNDEEKAKSLIDTLRVIINSDGEALDFKRAKQQHEISPDIIFIRHDRWALGAENCHKDIAYNMWRDEWTHFYLVKEQKLKPIADY